MSDDPAPDIETSPRDRLIALTKGLSSFAPGIGPLIAGILLDDLPGQRQDRIVDYIRLLDARLSAVELEASRSQPDAVDLLEEGALQSVRAVSEERRQRIAEMVAYGMRGDAAARLESRRLLRLLEQIDDAQLVILASMLQRHRRDGDFHQRHEAVLGSSFIALSSSLEERDKATTRELGRDELVRLGLLADKFNSPKPGELPDLDRKTGMMKSSGRQLTPLGRLLLRRTGLATDEEH